MKAFMHLIVLVTLFFATNVNAQTTSIVEFQDNFNGALPLGLAAQPEDFAVSLTDMVLGDQSGCLLYTSPSPRDRTRSRMPSSA